MSKYQTVYEDIKKKIVTGVFPEATGSKLHCARATIKQATISVCPQDCWRIEPTSYP